MYRILPDVEVVDQIAALPEHFLHPMAEALALLEIAPQSGLLCNNDKPHGLRDLLFGPKMAGKLTYLLLEDQREVHLLRLQCCEYDEGA